MTVGSNGKVGIGTTTPTGKNNMSKLTNKKAVRDLALGLAKAEGNGRTRVSDYFLQHVEYETRRAISNRVLHHDNKTGSRKTLV
jgi:hypothetical protein